MVQNLPSISTRVASSWHHCYEETASAEFKLYRWNWVSGIVSILSETCRLIIDIQHWPDAFPSSCHQSKCPSNCSKQTSVGRLLILIYPSATHGRRQTYGYLPSLTALVISVATQLRCGGMFNDDFIANLIVSLPVKGFWKSDSEVMDKSLVSCFLVHSIYRTVWIIQDVWRL